MVHNGIPPDFMSPGVSDRNRIATHWSAPVDDVTIAILTILHLIKDYFSGIFPCDAFSLFPFALLTSVGLCPIFTP